MESPFSHRFNTNYVPSDGEIECIRNDLVPRAQELERIDERIRALSAQRDQLQAYIDHHRALISHPRRLPPDIVREIFVACLPTSRNAVMSAQEAPLLLCRICSAWKTIALSTPRLWASLHVPFRYILSSESRMPVVAKWLALSAACPISLSVDYTDNWHDFGEDQSSRALLKCLADFSTRWQHIEFTSLTRTCPKGLAKIIAPALESLKFTGDLTQLEIFQALSLRSLSLHHSTLEKLPDDAVLTLPLAWDRLTHVTLQTGPTGNNWGGFSLPSIVVLLRRCSHLISLNVTPRLSEDGVDDAPSEPISLPFLETFILGQPGCLTPHAVIQLIELVSMPRLRQIDASTTASQGRDSYFLVSLGTKSPDLENLTMHLNSLTAQSLPETLLSFSSLTKLVVFDFRDSWGDNLQDPFHPCNPEQLLHLLTPIAETITVCPALQELVVTTSGTLQKHTLDALIEGRLEFTPCFRRVEMAFRNSWVSELMSEAEIHTYSSRGLDIYLVYDSTWQKLPTTSPWTGLVDEGWSVG